MSDLTDFCDRIRTVADEAFGPFPYMTATEAVDEIEKGIYEYKRAVAVALAALERLTREVAAVSGVDEAGAAKQVDSVLVGRAA